MMKRMRYIWSAWLAVVLLASCEEKLPEFEVTTVTIGAEWKDANLHLTTGMDLASGVEVIEQGFVLELPVYIGGGHWHDYPDSREKRTVKVPAGTTEYTLLSEGWEPGLKCTVYAYVKTNAGNYRSRVEELDTPEPAYPEFTGFTHTPSEDGPWVGGGTLVIEGKNFMAAQGALSVFVVKEPAGSQLVIQELTPDRIVASYPGGQFGQVGEYEVKVIIVGREYVLSQKMVVDGIRILSIEPEKPRHGEKVKMYLENFKPGSLRNVDVPPSTGLDILEEADGCITFRAPEYPAGEFTLQLQDNFMIWSKPFVMTMAAAWKELDLAQVGLESLQLNTDAWLSPKLQHSIFHDGKTYLLDYKTSHLLVFEGDVPRGRELPLPEMDFPGDGWNPVNAKLFAWKESLYLFASAVFPGDMEHDYAHKQYLCRMDLQTERWELVEEIPESVLSDDNLTFAVTEDGVAYASSISHSPWQYKLMEYHITEGVWKESARSLPAYSRLMGSRGNTLYYHDYSGDGGIYGIDFSSGEGAVKVLEAYYPNEYFIVAGDYLYYMNGYTFCRTRLSPPYLEEERLGTPCLGVYLYDWDYCWGVPIHASDAPCLLWQTPRQGLKFYRYIPQ